MASLATRLQDLATRIATECKAIRILVNGGAANLAALTTTAKGNLVLAINELKAEVATAAQSGGATINDASDVSATQTYSINKITSEIEDAKLAVKSAILGGAGAAYDTLIELQGLLQGSDNAIAAINLGLGNRLRFEAAQVLSTPQKAQGNANLGSAALIDTGVLDTDFVATFTAGLV